MNSEGRRIPKVAKRSGESTDEEFYEMRQLVFSVAEWIIESTDRLPKQWEICKSVEGKLTKSGFQLHSEQSEWSPRCLISARIGAAKRMLPQIDRSNIETRIGFHTDARHIFCFSSSSIFFLEGHATPFPRHGEREAK